MLPTGAISNKEITMKYPKNKEEHAYLRDLKYKNLGKCKTNKSENWMYEKLVKTKFKWSRQSMSGFRFFDFWCHELGVAVEVDGLDHDKNYDSFRDNESYIKRGIIVLRVNNMNEKEANEVITKINKCECWNNRRINLGLKPITN